MKRYIVTEDQMLSRDKTVMAYRMAIYLEPKAFESAGEILKQARDETHEREIPEPATHVCWQDKQTKHWIMKEI